MGTRAKLVYPGDTPKDDLSASGGYDFRPKGETSGSLLPRPSEKSKNIIAGISKTNDFFNLDKDTRDKLIAAQTAKIKKNAEDKSRELIRKTKSEIKRKAKNAAKSLLKGLKGAIGASLDKLLKMVENNVAIPEPVLLESLKSMNFKGSIEYKNYGPLKLMVMLDKVMVVDWMKETRKLSGVYGTTGLIIDSAKELGSTRILGQRLKYYKDADIEKFDNEKLQLMKDVLYYGDKHFIYDAGFTDKGELADAFYGNYFITTLANKYIDDDFSMYGYKNNKYGNRYTFSRFEVDRMFPEKIIRGVKYTYVKNKNKYHAFKKLLTANGNENKKLIDHPLLYERIFSNIPIFEETKELTDEINNAIGHITDDIVKILGERSTLMYIYLKKLIDCGAIV